MLMCLRSMPATRSRFSVGIFGANPLLLEVRAYGDDLNLVDVPEVVAQVEFAEVKRNSEFGELGSV